MPVALTTSVRREISRLRRDIARRTSELVSLNDEIKKHERVLKLLGGDHKVTRRAGLRARGRATINWNLLLKGLPKAFTIDSLSKRNRARTKSRLYLRQVLLRWVKQGKIKRIGRGKYQKV